MPDDIDDGTQLIANHLRHLYWKRNLSMRGIARELNVSAATISNWFRHFKIPIKPPTQDGRFLNITEHRLVRPRDAYSYVSTHIRRAERGGLPKCCNRCGSTKHLVVHHRDHNHLNNDIANLERLCRSCHAKEHDAGRFFRRWHAEQK